MAEDNFRIWMVRAGQGSYLIEDFLQQGIIAIGWNDLGPLDPTLDYYELKEQFREAYPEDSDGRVNQCVGQIWRFLHEFNIRDKVVSYDSSGREYFLGTVESEYLYDETMEYYHYRKVSWLSDGTDRDVLSPEAKNTLGSISTIFELPKNVWEELLHNHSSSLSQDTNKAFEEAPRELQQQNLNTLKEDIISRSQEFIKDIISNLSWQDTELLVAGLLKSMGYRIRMTSNGGDLGSDIIASPDELGLEEPRIRVEVKKRSKDKIRSDEIRNFIGGMRGYHKGVYVTTSGFSKEAIYEAERANFAITLIDSNWLVELLVSNYEALEPEIKALVPLKKIYWPV